MTRWRRWKPWAGRATIALALGLAAYLLHRTFSRYGLDEMRDAVLALPAVHLLLAALFAASSYATLTLFDTLAVRWVRRRIPYPRIAFTSFVSLSIGHSVGLAGLSSGAIRYRYYSRWGMTVEEVAKVILFTGTTVGLGLATLAGFTLMVAPKLAAELLGLPRAAVLAVALACLAGVVAYLGLAATLRGRLRIRSSTLEMPDIRLATGQVLVGTVNFSLVAACLHQCIAGIADVPYPSVVAVYVIGNVATLITHVPGGIGIIESVTLHLMPADRVIGAVIAFRVIYFLVPLAIGGTASLVTEVVLRRRKRQAGARAAR